MELIWRKNVGMKIAIAPRSLLVAASVVLAIYAPDYLPRWMSTFFAALEGF